MSRAPRRVHRLAEWDAVRRAKVARLAHDYERAESILEKVARDGAGPPVWHLLALTRQDLNDLGGAVSAGRRVVAARGSDPRGYLLLARAAAAAGNHDEAAAALQMVGGLNFPDLGAIEAGIPQLIDAGQVGIAELLVDRVRRGEVGTPPDGWLDQTGSLVALAKAERSGVDALDAAVNSLAERGSSDEQAAVLRWALGRQDYRRAASLVGRVPATKLPTASIQRATRLARDAGHLRAAATLAKRLVDVGAADRRSETIADIGRQELDLLDNGWRFSEPASLAYEPNPRRIAYLLHNSLPYASDGYATRSHGLLGGLARLGWSVDGVTRLGYPYDTWERADPRSVGRLDVVDGIAYHRLLTSSRTYPKTPFQRYAGAYAELVATHARKQRPAIMHAASNYRNGIVAVEVARRLGLPSVYEMRGLWEVTRWSRIPDYNETDSYQLAARMEADACRFASRALAITGALKREMVDRGVPEEHITVLPNGVDTRRFQPKPRDVALARSLGVHHKTVIGYVGTINGYEGIDLLLDATARLAGNRDDFHVLVVGDGEAYQYCLDLRERLGVQLTTTFTGRVPHEDVERYYSLIDIAPFPRKPLPVCEMVSPLKPFEAMAAGVTPVVSSCAALTEIITDGVTGLVFQKGDVEHLAAVLAKALADQSMREVISRQALEWVRRERDWTRLAGTLDEIYVNLLAEHRPANV